MPENIELSKYSVAFFEDFAETMAVDGVKAEVGLKRNGYLFIVPPSSLDMLRHYFDTQRQLGCNVDWLERDEHVLEGQMHTAHLSDPQSFVDG